MNINFIKKILYGLLFFFLFFFIWQRVFIFAYQMYGTPLPRIRAMLPLAVVSSGAALAGFARCLKSRQAFLIPSIEIPIQRILLNFKNTNTIIIFSLFIISAFAGPSLAFFKLNINVGWLSKALSSIGAAILIFIFLLWLSAKKSTIRRYIRLFISAFKNPRFISAVLLLNIFSTLFLLTAKQPLYWDNAGYWRTAAELSRLAFTNPPALFRQSADSVFINDYHYLPAILPAYAMAIFNTGRLAFILSVVNFYVIPFWALLFTLTKDRFFGFGACVMALIFVPYLAVTGFLDVGGVMFSFACLYLFLYKDEGFLSGLTLLFAVMYRRWYIFFAAAFILCAFIHSLLRKGKRQEFLWLLAGFGIPMFLIFQGYVSGILLRENFADTYSAYRFAMLSDVRFILRYFGLIMVLGIFIFSLYSAFKKKGGFKSFFPLCCCLIIFFLFTAIQSFGMQHLLLFAAPAAIICVSALQERTRLPAVVISFLCFTSVFLPRAQPQTLQEIKNYAPLPAYSVYPSIRADAAQLQELDSFIRSLNGKTAVLASSFHINSDLLSMIKPSLNSLQPLEANEKIIHTAQVDKRDGLPLGLESADYIVTAYPIQTHLDPQEQRCVTVPAGALLTDSPFSQAFKKMGQEFELINGIEIYIYERIRENTAEETEWLWRAIALEPSS